MSKLGLRAIRIAMFGMLLLGVIPEPTSAQTTPWWKQQKIVFMWGQWNHARVDKNQPFWGADLPQSLFQDIAVAGATVFTEMRGYKPQHAIYAHGVGMKYFATQFATDINDITVPGARRAVMKTGEYYPADTPWCPLEDRIYRKLLVEPYLQGASIGYIDGLHIDWELYSGGEAGICYCDSCFSIFMQNQGIQGEMPEATERYAWLEARDLVLSYEQNYHTRRQAMFSVLAGELRAVKPDLVISSYDAFRCYDFGKGVHTPQTPFIFLDPRHYGNDDRQPWWESYSARFKQEGYLYIPGGWTNALFGAQASQVSAARWLYEAAVNEDGVWLWFERELDDEILRAYASANHQLKTVQSRVGQFLLNGQRDPNFVTAVEWTGRPELSQAIITRTYHLGQEHLLHINNVDTECPVRVRLRLPYLTGSAAWSVLDPMGGVYYSRNGTSTTWTTSELMAGVVVSIEPRSDLFLLVSPGDGPQVDASRVVRSQEFERLPDHLAASAQAGPVQNSTPATVFPSEALVYTATEAMGFDGPEGGFTLGNSVRTLSTSSHLRVRQLRGHLWSPSYSPDGQKIVFVHDTGGRGQIYIMNENGSNAINISNNTFCDRGPVWSPDGTKIAFLSDRTGDWDIHVMNADGSGQRKLAGNTGLDRAPAWSPNGRIAWESHTSGIPNIWVCDADGQNSHPLIPPDSPIRVQ